MGTFRYITAVEVQRFSCSAFILFLNEKTHLLPKDSGIEYYVSRQNYSFVLNYEMISFALTDQLQLRLSRLANAISYLMLISNGLSIGKKKVSSTSKAANTEKQILKPLNVIQYPRSLKNFVQLQDLRNDAK